MAFQLKCFSGVDRNFHTRRGGHWGEKRKIIDT